ncbi:MAG: hypothetical protein LAO24_05705 [Acidobacteriia bacterium]|nr:hypothetical protein [Terriglobia bacterium]
MSPPREIAGGLGTKVQHGTSLPTNACPFSVYVLTSDPARPQLFICNADGAWVPCVMGTLT